MVAVIGMCGIHPVGIRISRTSTILKMSEGIMVVSNRVIQSSNAISNDFILIYLKI